MSKEKLPPLTIGDYELKVPIVQGGMSVAISGASLASAVDKCGGAGTIGGVGRGLGARGYREHSGFEADRLALRDELQKAKDLNPHGIYGVNVLVAVTDYEGLVRVAIENGTKFIVSGAGLPLNLPELTADHPEVALIPIVSSTQAVRIICRRWYGRYNRLPDAIIIEEPSTAGGHLGVTSKQNIESGDLKLEKVIPECRAYLDEAGFEIPIIAAGGIWDRSDIDRVLGLGANGVQMATRFVCTPECDAPQEFQQKYLDSTPESIVIIDSPVGMPGRAIKTKLLDRVGRGEINHQCSFGCLQRCGLRDSGQTYCIVKALSSAREGDVENGIVFAGSNAHRSKEQGIVPVKQIFEELTATE